MEKACNLAKEDLLNAVVSRAASAKANAKANAFSGDRVVIEGCAHTHQHFLQ